MSEFSSDELRARLRTLSTATAVDILRPHEPQRLVINGVHPVRRVSKTIAGPARTVRFLPRRGDVPAGPNGSVWRELVDRANPGDIMVLDALGNCEGAVLGDMMALRAEQRGVAAVVTDGAMRDLAGMEGLSLAVYARAVVPMAVFPHLIPWEAECAVQCGGALVQPGDWIVADAECAIVVPRPHLEMLANGAAAFLAEEEFCRRLLIQGLPLSQAYPLPAPLRPLFERYLRDETVPSADQVRDLLAR